MYRITILLVQDHMTVAAYMCGRHLNSTACHLLANLCTLTLHQRDHPACSTLKRIQDRNNDQTSRLDSLLYKWISYNHYFKFRKRPFKIVDIRSYFTFIVFNICMTYSYWYLTCTVQRVQLLFLPAGHLSPPFTCSPVDPKTASIYLRTLKKNIWMFRRVPRLFLPAGQSSSTLESEAISTSHLLHGRGDPETGSHRLNLTVARYLRNYAF